MVDATSVRGFTIESPNGVGVPRHGRMQHFDGALSAHLHVLGEIDTSHSAGAQELEHVVTFGNDRADEIRGHTTPRAQCHPVFRAEPLGFGILEAAGWTDLECAHDGSLSSGREWRPKDARIARAVTTPINECRALAR